MHFTKFVDHWRGSRNLVLRAAEMSRNGNWKESENKSKLTKTKYLETLIIFRDFSP